MADHLIGHTAAIGGTCARGIPATWHSPGDDFFQTIDQSIGWRVVVWRMIIAKGCETEAVVVATIVRTTWEISDRSRATGENVSVLINEEVIADVAPTIHIHVIVLNTTDLRFRVRQSAGAVIARSCGVMNDGAIQGRQLRNAALRRTGVPARTIANRRLRGFASLRHHFGSAQCGASDNECSE